MKLFKKLFNKKPEFNSAELTYYGFDDEFIEVVREIHYERHPEWNWFDAITGAVAWQENGTLYVNKSDMRNKKIEKLGL